MYSFDVFDTLISRVTATPRGIFALMKNRMIAERNAGHPEACTVDEYVLDNFYELRIHSEELARKAGNFQAKEEVSLGDIYEAMAVCGCLEERQTAYLSRLEQETEIANVIGIPGNIRRLKELLKQGERVVLISDMYLPAATIRKMLLQVDDVFRTISFYVSSEYGRRKTTGNLYRLVQEMEQVRYEDWTHIGDNLHQDIEVPYCLGIRVELYDKVELSDFEKGILQAYGDDCRLQLMIGTAADVERTERTKREDRIKQDHINAYHIGCRYAGPVLYGYAEWIVKQAVRKNIRRLYFIARDGYLVKKIVDVLIKKKRADIKTGYLYGSRKAWRMASLSERHYNLYQLILWSHHRRITTLDELAVVLHVPLEGLYGFLPGTFARNRENRQITDQELERIVKKLSLDEGFRAYHLHELENERKLVQAYLKQEVDVGDDHFAFVDVSGGGLTQGCLWELLKEQYKKPIHTFFFKVDRVNLAEGSVTDTFMPCFLENNIAVEMLCRAPHGQTQGYLDREGCIVPILEDTEGASLVEHGFYAYEKGIMDFSEKIYEVSVRYSKSIGVMNHDLSIGKMNLDVGTEVLNHDVGVEVLNHDMSIGEMNHDMNTGAMDCDMSTEVMDYDAGMKVKDCNMSIGTMKNELLYLKHIAEEPSCDVLEYFASMPSSESGRSKVLVEYAPRLTETDIKEIFLGRTDETIERFYQGTDLNYSLLRATDAEKALIEQCKREHDTMIGKLYRQDKERVQKNLWERYGSAAFYPIRLLEERLVLYGAGKFGQNLRKRLKEDGEHEIVMWIDKKAEYYRQQGMAEVQEVAELAGVSFDQIVIAVVDKEVGREIQKELEQAGIDKEKMIWLQPFRSPNQMAEWCREGIG